MDFPNELPVPIISTGVSLSDRFKGMNDGQTQHKLMRGGYGYGGPSSPSPSIFSQPRHNQHNFGTTNDFDCMPQNQNLRLAESLFRRHQLQQNMLIRKERLAFGLQQGHLNNPMHKPPVRHRIGFNEPARNNMFQGKLAGRGGVAKATRNVSVQRGGSGGGRVVARGGGGSRGGRGRRSHGKGQVTGSGISPLNRAKGAGNDGIANDKWYGPQTDKNALDKELDSYMSQSKKKAKCDLDKEMDEYMRIAREKSLASAAASGASPTNVQLEEDMIIAEDA